MRKSKEKRENICELDGQINSIMSKYNCGTMERE